jgi:SAM-dependent methyltransferase
MHPEAYEWVSRYATNAPITVLDIGGRDINGTCRPLFPNATYTCIDVREGPAVDLVADAATWTPDTVYDLVLCTEVFEHTDVWPQICATAYAACAPGGRFVATMAGPGRAVHSAVDGGPELHPGEHYANVEPEELRLVLKRAGFEAVLIDQAGTDVRALAHRSEWVPVKEAVHASGDRV